MQAILKGLSKPDELPDSLQHVQIIPFNPTAGLIMNNESISSAEEHNNLMTQLRKKSITGFANNTNPQDIKEMPEPAKTRAAFTLREFLISQKTLSNNPLFHSIKSRGKNGYLVIG